MQCLTTEITVRYLYCDDWSQWQFRCTCTKYTRKKLSTLYFNGKQVKHWKAKLICMFHTLKNQEENSELLLLTCNCLPLWSTHKEKKTLASRHSTRQNLCGTDSPHAQQASFLWNRHTLKRTNVYRTCVQAVF